MQKPLAKILAPAEELYKHQLRLNRSCWQVCVQNRDWLGCKIILLFSGLAYFWTRGVKGNSSGNREQRREVIWGERGMDGEVKGGGGGWG